MAFDAWLPVGHELPDGARLRLVLFEGPNWQIVETLRNEPTLLVDGDIARRWENSGLVALDAFAPIPFAGKDLWAISSGHSQVLCPVAEGRSPDTKADALSFALALRATRNIDPESPIQDALFVEKISRLLPTYSISSRLEDDVVLGYWLTGGATVSVKSFRRLCQMMSWLGSEHLEEIVKAAGFEVREAHLVDQIRSPAEATETAAATKTLETKLDRPGETGAGSASSAVGFELAGRPEIAVFLNEYVIDIIVNRERYRSMGITFPSGIVLHGPPGCGKTYAVEHLIDFLGWPSYQIDASSVASPFIHETSRKVAGVFRKAMENAPSVLVIDEMEALLADRGADQGHHRVEEVAEFLRLIPEATENDVLVIAMTNRIEMIDPAILRRGRFDHVVKVDYPSEMEVLSLLDKLLSSLPTENGIDPRPLARELAGRPLSDVAFVVREGARLSARSGKDHLDQSSLQRALETSPAREREGGEKRRIGFF